jgi:adenylate cyclase
MLTRKNAHSQALDNTYGQALGYTHLNSAEADQMKVEEVITHRIVQLLEAGTVPWHKPWAKRHTGSDAFPRILCADVFGYSRLMGEDEEATHRTLTSYRKLIDSVIEQHRGRFVNSAGDSVLAEFASVVNAVQCAVEVQSALKVENAGLAPERRMQFRIGINLGDVIVDGVQIYGDGVNVAARLESLAEPGGICISDTVHAQVRDKLALGYEDCGAQTVKNIARPVHVWRVLLNGTAPSRALPKPLPRKYWRGGALSVAGLAIIIATVVAVQHLSLKPQPTHASIPPQEKPSLPLPRIPSIAVLPFSNLSGDSGQEYFSDGLSDQLINQLSRVPGLFVIARNSSFSYKGKTVDEHEIGRELGVKYIPEGSVRKAADQVRIGVELVDAATGAEMWTENYNQPLQDIFALQDEIVNKVTTTLGLLMGLQRAPSYEIRDSTQNLEAFDDYLRAEGYMWQYTQAGDLKARQWGEQAVKLDPEYPSAYDILAAAYVYAVPNQWSTNPAADLARSFELAQKALALDDSNSFALTTICAIDWIGKHFNEAIDACQRAAVINPNDARGYVQLSEALTFAVRPQEAVSAVEKAMRLDPTHQDYYAFVIASPYVEMGRFQEAVSLLNQHLAAYPDNIWAHLGLANVYVELGRDVNARAEAAEVMRLNPKFTLANLLATANPAMNRRVQKNLRKAGLK